MLVTELVRLQSMGAVPGNNVFMDGLLWFIGGVSGFDVTLEGDEKDEGCTY